MVTLGYADKREKGERKTPVRNIVYFEEWGKTES